MHFSWLNIANCSVGTFFCDEMCKPQYMICNKKVDCSNGEDESPFIDCSKHETMYQVCSHFFKGFYIDKWNLKIVHLKHL